MPGVSTADPASYGAVLIALTMAAVPASAAPIMRALHITPTRALKVE